MGFAPAEPDSTLSYKTFQGQARLNRRSGPEQIAKSTRKYVLRLAQMQAALGIETFASWFQYLIFVFAGELKRIFSFDHRSVSEPMQESP